MTLTTAANSAVPGNFRLKAYDEAAVKGARGHAAAIVFVAPDGDVLVLRRSGAEKNFAHHWGLPGGGVEEGETPELGAMRESKEEIGMDVDPEQLKGLHKTVTPTGLAFHTFALPVKEKFAPVLNEEHTGYDWSPLNCLPAPLHPGLETMVRDHLGVAADMAPEDWTALRDGFLKWTAEEEAEPAHQVDIGATDSALVLALDRDSVREFTREGRLKVSVANITKANVCPYRGEEIPGWEALGLEKNKIYNLLRDPEEIRKGAETSNGVQLLQKHVPVSAEDHQPYDTIGSLGTDAEFDGVYLKNSLFVNAKSAIDGIETKKKRELSAGYHYRPDMTPGKFGDKAYDGVMRDIVFNHVALVEDGRAGPDVVVGDSALKENDAMKKPTRIAAMTLGITAAHIAPLLAMDSKITLPKDLFTPLTSKNFKESKPALLAGVRLAVDGKLRKGIALDASMQGLAKAIDAFEELSSGVDEPASEEVAKEMETAAAVQAPPAAIAEEKPAGFDAEPLKNFLREKGMGEDDIIKACDMMPKPATAALDADETPEEKATREKKEKDDQTAKDNDMKDTVTKPAMDAALRAHGETVAAQVAKSVRDTERGIRAALSEVKPFVGELPITMAFDSAPDVFRHALTMLGIADAKTMHADALRPVLLSQKKPGATPHETPRELIAMDADSVTKAKKHAPGLEHISTVC